MGWPSPASVQPKTIKTAEGPDIDVKTFKMNAKGAKDANLKKFQKSFNQKENFDKKYAIPTTDLNRDIKLFNLSKDQVIKDRYIKDRADVKAFKEKALQSSATKISATGKGNWYSSSGPYPERG